MSIDLCITITDLSYLDLLIIMMVSLWSPRGEIHNLRLSNKNVGSKGLSFSLCGGLLMHSYLVNLVASHSCDS